jgi:hypothetical protein
MKRIETGNPDRLEYRSLSGLPGFFFGALMVFGGWVATKTPMIEGPPWAADAMAYGLVTLGVMAATMRYGMIIDRALGVYRSWFGFLYPWFWRTRSLDVSQVRLTREEYRSKGVTYVHYTIELKQAGRPLNVGMHNDNVKAWSIAQELAEFLDVPLTDESGMHPGPDSFRPRTSTLRPHDAGLEGEESVPVLSAR